MKKRNIKGVLLAGGEGTRLRPLTIATNKHLLRVGKLPMIQHPLSKMIEAGIVDIHVVTGGENYQGVVKYLGSGSQWGVKISYSIQDNAGGIAEALGLARAFIGDDRMLVILGDNVFTMSLKKQVAEFRDNMAECKAILFVDKSDTPNRFGVLKYDRGGNIVDILEKPKKAPSRDIVTGIYMYTPDVFQVIKTLKPSGRGELEITDVNRTYIQTKRLKIVHMSGDWTDCGTFDTLLKAESQVSGV